MYDRNVTKWRSYDDRDILIKDLDTRHLVNILNWISQHSDKYEHALYEFLEGEAKYRIMLGFAANEGVPHKQEDGQWTILNLSKKEAAKHERETKHHNRELQRTVEAQARARRERKKKLAEKTGWDEDDIF